MLCCESHSVHCLPHDQLSHHMMKMMMMTYCPLSFCFPIECYISKQLAIIIRQLVVYVFSPFDVNMKYFSLCKLLLCVYLRFVHDL